MTPTQQGVYQVRAVSGDNVDVQTVFAVSARIAELNIPTQPSLMQQLVAQYKALGTEAVWMSSTMRLSPLFINKLNEPSFNGRRRHFLAFAPIWFLLLVPAVMGAVLIRHVVTADDNRIARLPFSLVGSDLANQCLQRWQIRINQGDWYKRYTPENKCEAFAMVAS